jgi:hypothetical protein
MTNDNIITPKLMIGTVLWQVKEHNFNAKKRETSPSVQFWLTAVAGENTEDADGELAGCAMFHTAQIHILKNNLCAMLNNMKDCYGTG